MLFKHPNPLRVLRGQSPLMRNKVPPQHRLTAKSKKADNKPKKRNLNKPPHEKPQKCSYNPIRINKTEPTTCGGKTNISAPSRAAATAAVPAG